MPYHILLIDDDPYFQSEFTELMEDFDTVGAANGQEAIKILKRPHNIDLIIVDEMMPGIKGTDLLNEIRKYAPDVRTVLLTGCGSKEIVIRALQGQAADFIEKPLNDEKIEKIKHWILLSPRGEKDKNIRGVKGKIEQAKYFAQRNYDKRLTLDDVANEVCLSPKYLSRLFKERTGVIFSEYKLKLRMEKAKDMLKNTGDNVEEIAHQLGYQNPGSFIKIFHKFNRCTPRQFRDRHF